jgi:hypothetical protein
MAGVSLRRLALPLLLSTTTLSAPRADLGLGLHRLDSRSVAQVRALGIRHIRYTLYWALWSDPAYRSGWEADLRRAVAAGLAPLVVVHSAPAGTFLERQQVYVAFSRFMEARAAEFPEVHAWQLWNEMDVGFTDLFGAGRKEISLRQRGRFYGEMLRLAYPAIKRGNRNALVVVGGVASPIEDGFLEGLYDSHAPYDVLAVHTYGFPLEVAFRDRALAARRVMSSHHDRRPLWNTEFGLESAVIPAYLRGTAAQTDSIHLAAWQATLKANVQNRLYDRIYGYVLAEGTDLGFGLVRPDGSPRPTYIWLKSWLHHR